MAATQTNDTPLGNNLTSDMASLRKDFGTLRMDVREDMAALRTDLSKVTKDVTRAAMGGGKHAVEVVEHGIEERPLMSALVAFGTGVSLGFLVSRR